MKKELNFTSPFYQWGGLGFYNCYAAVYMYLQGTVVGNIVCNAKESKGCNECGNCSVTLNNLFQTIDGCWTTRQSWSGEKTKIQKNLEKEFGNASNASDKLVDFIIGFTGYDYKKITEKFEENVLASIDANKPVIAKLKDDKWPVDLSKGYRIISGYDNNALIEADYRPAADLKEAIEYIEIECLYIFGETIPQKNTFLDFLKIIEEAMDSDFTEGIWYEFIKNFDYEGGRLWERKSSEIKNRFKRLLNVMDWIPNIGHGFQTAFSNRQLLTVLGADINQLGELFDVIGNQTHLLHSRGYMLSAISDCVNNLNINDDGEFPYDKCGLITATWQILDSIMDCDLKMLLAVKKAIKKLS
jgi:hypothetical protein